MIPPMSTRRPGRKPAKSRYACYDEGGFMVAWVAAPDEPENHENKAQKTSGAKKGKHEEAESKGGVSRVISVNHYVSNQEESGKGGETKHEQ